MADFVFQRIQENNLNIAPYASIFSNDEELEMAVLHTAINMRALMLNYKHNIHTMVCQITHAGKTYTIKLEK